VTGRRTTREPGGPAFARHLQRATVTSRGAVGSGSGPAVFYCPPPEYAVTDGTVVPVIGSNGNGWNTLGDYTVMLRAA
jgi:hypothetical protein